MEPKIIYGKSVRVRAKHRRAMRRKELQRDVAPKAHNHKAEAAKQLREELRALDKAKRLNDRVGRAVKMANEEEARKPEQPAKRAKYHGKWYAPREDENYIHAKAPRQCGEKPLDRIRYN